MPWSVIVTKNADNCECELISKESLVEEYS